jgi:DNA-binding response OmpR family regulator
MSEQHAAWRAGPTAAGILVVEDFAPLRVLLDRVLTAEGHRVTVVGTAPVAQARCASAQFDLVVTDVHIPGGNGVELARQVAGEHPGLRVLFVSGDSRGDLDLQVPGAHTDFLQKPFDIDELVERVGRLLAVGPAEPPSPGD